MPRKPEEGAIADIEGMESASSLALGRLLSYAAREAAAQNRFTAAKLIQAAIASLGDEAARKGDQPHNFPVTGRC